MARLQAGKGMFKTGPGVDRVSSCCCACMPTNRTDPKGLTRVVLNCNTLCKRARQASCRLGRAKNGLDLHWRRGCPSIFQKGAERQGTLVRSTLPA